MENAEVSDHYNSGYASFKSTSFNNRTAEADFRNSWNREFGFGANDRRLGYSRQASFQKSHEPHTPIPIFRNDSVKPFLSRTVSSVDIPPVIYPLEEYDQSTVQMHGSAQKFSVLLLVPSVFRLIRSGNKPTKRLFILISLNVAYSTAELLIGLLSGRVGMEINPSPYILFFIL